MVVCVRAPGMRFLVEWVGEWKVSKFALTLFRLSGKAVFCLGMGYFREVFG